MVREGDYDVHIQSKQKISINIVLCKLIIRVSARVREISQQPNSIVLFRLQINWIKCEYMRICGDWVRGVVKSYVNFNFLGFFLILKIL